MKPKNFLLLLFLISLFGCVVTQKIQKPVVKYFREQKCSPNKWFGIPIDTSSEYRRVAESYYIFEPVKDINSQDNEWGLSFLSEREAILTYDNNAQQLPILVTFVNESRARISTGLSVPLDGHLGSFSIAGNIVYFARSPFGENPKELTGNSDIYSGRIIKNVISNPQSLPEPINTNFLTWESHPSISPNGKVLFFSSDRIPYKGPDIFFVFKLPDGTWSEPFNCGDSINTECDEITPFVTSDGKYLLFSSTGHENIGGYDLFQSQISEAFWKEIDNYKPGKFVIWDKFFAAARNLRPPTNTIYDEISPSTPKDPQELLYYSSNQFDLKDGSGFRRGGFDMFVRYKFTKAKPVAEAPKRLEPKLEVKEELVLPQPELKLAPNFKLFGYVFETERRQPLPNANLYVFQFDTLLQSFPDIKTTKPLFSTRTKNDGYYEFSLLKNVDYQVFAESQQFFYESKKVRMELTEPANEMRLDFYLPIKFTLRINFPLDVYDRPYRYILDSNGVETNLTWEEELDMLALNIINSSPFIKKIVLVGHTDDIASEEYNIRLGQNRVNFVISQLLKRGVSSEILEGISAGESQPLPRRPNEDIETYRKRLRRVEISKIY
ncbi:MAG: hypothetical protein N2517_03620 [Ignavibacteria bacterium]|nr:hypothetical protein [Ignavibacteria bacterium]